MEKETHPWSVWKFLLNMGKWKNRVVLASDVVGVTADMAHPCPSSPDSWVGGGVVLSIIGNWGGRSWGTGGQ